jgi:integrase
MIRKTFATMLHASGMPTRYISDLLGHSDMVTTEKNYILTYRDNYDTLLACMKQGLDFKI